MCEAADAVAKRIQVAADHRGPDARFERGGEQRRGATARDAHAADAARVQIRPGRDVVEHAHHVPHPPADHRFTEQQRTAGGGLAALLREAVTRVDRIAAAPERHRFNRHRRQTGLHHLDGEVVRVARLVGSIASLFVDADDVVDAAPVTGHADHGGRGRGRAVGIRTYTSTLTPGRLSNTTFSRR